MSFYAISIASGGGLDWKVFGVRQRRAGRRWLAVAGRCRRRERWGIWGGLLFIRLGICVAGFMVKFLIFELGGQEFDGAAELSAEAGFVAVEAFEGAAIVYQMLVGDGGAEVSAATFELSVDLGLLAVHLELHEGALEGDDAVEAPAAGDQLIDEVELGAGLGLVMAEVFFAEGVVLLVGFE